MCTWNRHAVQLEQSGYVHEQLIDARTYIKKDLDSMWENYREYMKGQI